MFVQRAHRLCGHPGVARGQRSPDIAEPGLESFHEHGACHGRSLRAELPDEGCGPVQRGAALSASRCRNLVLTGSPGQQKTGDEVLAAPSESSGEGIKRLAPRRWLFPEPALGPPLAR